MKLLSRKGDEVTYEATFFDEGRYVRRAIRDRITPRYRSENGRLCLIGHRLANTARNVSYYPALEKALGIKWGEA